MTSNNLTKFDDYTVDSGISDQLTSKTSSLNDFSYTDAIAVDQQFEDIPQRKLLAADGNTGSDVFGRVETTRANQEGFYRILIPGNGAVPFTAFEIATSIGGAGGSATGFTFGTFQMLTGAAPGGNLWTIVPGYVYMGDLPTSNQGAGYLWVDGAAGNVIKLGT